MRRTSWKLTIVIHTVAMYWRECYTVKIKTVGTFSVSVYPGKQSAGEQIVTRKKNG